MKITITNKEYAPLISILDITTQVTVKTRKSPNCETEFHIDNALGLFESKYYDRVYDIIFHTYKQMGQLKQEKIPINP